MVLSATHNPYGSQVTNAQGIYVIDCQGSQVIVSNSRIVATLVFVNATSQVLLQNSINWEPTVSNFPAMMVQGSLSMDWLQQTSLSEVSVGHQL